MLPWEYVGWDLELAPLYDVAKLSGSKFLHIFLFIGTLFSAIASANGCINDPARAWFSMGRDRYLPVWFAAVHPKYRTPFRSIIFLIPIGIIFAIWAVSMLMGFIQSFTYAEIAGLFPSKSGGASVYGAAAWLKYGKFPARMMEDLGIKGGNDLGERRAGFLPYLTLLGGVAVMLIAKWIVG